MIRLNDRLRDLDKQHNDALSKLKSEAAVWDHERRELESMISTMQVQKQELECEFREYLWVSEKLHRAADLAGAVGGKNWEWGLEVRMEGVEAGGERVQGAAADISRLMHLLGRESEKAGKWEGEHDVLVIKVKELQRDVQIAEEEAGRARVEAEVR